MFHFCIQNGSILLYDSAHIDKGSRFMKNSSTYTDFYGSTHTERFHPCWASPPHLRPPTTRTRSGPTDRTPLQLKHANARSVCAKVRPTRPLTDAQRDWNNLKDPVLKCFERKLFPIQIGEPNWGTPVFHDSYSQQIEWKNEKKAGHTPYHCTPYDI
jgi:hypothetical protein